MKVVLVGNQNCGKTSLFNKLTGSNQKIGNWPGVTVEKKEGMIKDSEIEIVDLPGIYSLSSYTSEENITREYLFNHTPDLVVNVIDATVLERSLYLTTQLMDLNIPMIIAVNMIDLLAKQGCLFDDKKLSDALSIPIFKISAKTGFGLVDLVEGMKMQKTHNFNTNIKKYTKITENSIKNTKNILGLKNNFLAIERLTNLSDNESVELLRERQVICRLYGEDLEQCFAMERYEFISRVVKLCVEKGEKRKSKTEILDKVFLNKYFAIPIFICVISLMYFLSVGVVGRCTTSLITTFFESLSEKIQLYLKNLGVSEWLVSLIVDGMLTGVGSVLSFLPQLAVIFMVINLLEASGYMSRIAFIFDKIFYKVGLSGKSLIPFIIGSGCSVPAISATRTIEKEDEKQKTIVLAPFIPCSAKLPIISLFVGYFFPNKTGLLVASLYFLAVFLILISALVFEKFFFKKRDNSFLSELPEYKLPSLRYVLKDVCHRLKEFMVRAGTIIVLCSMLIWFLSSFSPNLRFCEDIQISILARIGDCFSWFFYPIIGEYNWAASVSAIQGLIAKEQVVSSMSIIAGLNTVEGVSSIFSSSVFAGFNRLSAYSFVVFNLYSAPCLASIGAMKNEFKSVKKTIFAVLFQIGIAWIVSTLIFQIGSCFVK